MLQEPLAIGPVPIRQRHAVRGVNIEHLLGRNHLDPVRINLQPQLFTPNPLNGVIAAPKRAKIPVCACVEKLVAHYALTLKDRKQALLF